MKYQNIKQGTFISRPNRFIAYVEIDGKEEVCHVKNTGRCKELLVPGCTVFVEESLNPARKTKFDLISVFKGDRLVNMDSQAPNKVFGEWVHNYFKNITLLKPEAKYKNSRFDFYIEAGVRKIFVEVKGVTLENDNVVLFPDAPTERGVKHINELCDSVKNGFEAYIFFIVQMANVKYFTPNKETHKEFADALKKARKNGVNICCVDCFVSKNELKVKDNVEVVL
ncbi:MAG: DNA/RNA nuclease SfsA [Clostridia bacterium]|nr:DNA/RNA nuclease SfsA [Clostridia bacterium]